MKLIKKKCLKETFHKKQRVSRQNSFNLLPSKALIQVMNVYIAHNIKPLGNILFSITALVEVFK